MHGKIEEKSCNTVPLNSLQAKRNKLENATQFNHWILDVFSIYEHDTCHRVHIGVEENQGECTVYVLSAGAYTTTMLVMVDRVKGGGRAPPALSRLGWFYHHDGMYARKWPLPLSFIRRNEGSDFSLMKPSKAHVRTLKRELGRYSYKHVPQSTPHMHILNLYL